MKSCHVEYYSLGSFLILYMEITIKNLIPNPLLDFPEINSEVWLNPSLRLTSNNKYLVYSQSGKGKTSLLSIIYGLRHDYKGEVIFDGDNIRNYDRENWADLRRNKISMVFQGLQLFDKLTVEENILLKNKLTDYSSETDILYWMDTLEIKSLYRKKVGEISFGQKQRVAIVRALCQPFDLLLLDEPFSHIDSLNREKALALVFSIAESQGSMLILSSLSDEYRQDFQQYRI